MKTFDELLGYYKSVMKLAVIGFDLDFPELKKLDRYSWDTPTNRAAMALFVQEELAPAMIRVSKQVPLKSVQEDFASLGDLMIKALDQLSVTEGDLN